MVCPICCRTSHYTDAISSAGSEVRFIAASVATLRILHAPGIIVGCKEVQNFWQLRFACLEELEVGLGVHNPLNIPSDVLLFCAAHEDIMRCYVFHRMISIYAYDQDHEIGSRPAQLSFVYVQGQLKLHSMTAGSKICLEVVLHHEYMGLA